MLGRFGAMNDRLNCEKQRAFSPLRIAGLALNAGSVADAALLASGESIPLRRWGRLQRMMGNLSRLAGEFFLAASWGLQWIDIGCGNGTFIFHQTTCREVRGSLRGSGD